MEKVNLKIQQLTIEENKIKHRASVQDQEFSKNKQRFQHTLNDLQKRKKDLESSITDLNTHKSSIEEKVQSLNEEERIKTLNLKSIKENLVSKNISYQEQRKELDKINEDIRKLSFEIWLNLLDMRIADIKRFFVLDIQNLRIKSSDLQLVLVWLETDPYNATLKLEFPDKTQHPVIQIKFHDGITEWRVVYNKIKENTNFRLNVDNENLILTETDDAQEIIKIYVKKQKDDKRGWEEIIRS